MSKDKKREILHATLQLVAEHGFHGAPCSLIAEQAGVAAGTIYRYFENKDVLINELYLELESRINIALQEDYSPDQTIRIRFTHLATELLIFFISFPLEFRFIEQFHNSPYGVEFRRDRIFGHKSGCDIYRVLFSQGVEQGVIKDLPLPVQFDLAFGPILAVARNHILGFIELDRTLIEQVVAACWDSLKT